MSPLQCLQQTNRTQGKQIVTLHTPDAQGIRRKRKTYIYIHNSQTVTALSISTNACYSRACYSHLVKSTSSCILNFPPKAQLLTWRGWGAQNLPNKQPLCSGAVGTDFYLLLFSPNNTAHIIGHYEWSWCLSFTKFFSNNVPLPPLCFTALGHTIVESAFYYTYIPITCWLPLCWAPCRQRQKHSCLIFCLLYLCRNESPQACQNMHKIQKLCG